MIIYKTTCLINGKIYIGQTSNNDPNYLGSGVLIAHSVRKYGKENFIREVLKDNIKNQQSLDFWEAYFIKKFDSTNPEIGYNILPGTANKFGSGSPMKIKSVAQKNSKTQKKRYRENPELRKKLSKRQKILYKNNPHLIDNLSKIGKELIGEKNPNFGNSWSEEQKEGLRQKMLGRYDGKNNPNFGNKMCEESRDKIRKLRRKVVIQYSLNDELIKVFVGCDKASEFTGISRNAITLCASGFNKTSGGYKWKYLKK